MSKCAGCHEPWEVLDPETHRCYSCECEFCRDCLTERDGLHFCDECYKETAYAKDDKLDARADEQLSEGR